MRAVKLLVGGTVISGLIGSKLPGTTGSTLTTVSTSMAPFVGPAVNVAGAGIVLNTLEDLNPKRKRQRRRLK